MASPFCFLTRFWPFLACRSASARSLLRFFGRVSRRFESGVVVIVSGDWYMGEFAAVLRSQVGAFENGSVLRVPWSSTLQRRRRWKSFWPLRWSMAAPTQKISSADKIAANPRL